MPSRSQIENEVKEDLAKNDEQLLTDIHEEILREDRRIEENIIHAYKRFSSLLVRSNRESIELQRTIKGLTWALYFLGGISAVVAVLILAKELKIIF